MRPNPGSYRTHALANQGEASIGLLVGLVVIAVGGITYLVLKQSTPSPSTTTPSATAPAAAPAPAVAPAQTIPPAPPAAVNPASNVTSLTPTKQAQPPPPYSGHAHGLQWLA